MAKKYAYGPTLNMHLYPGKMRFFPLNFQLGE